MTEALSLARRAARIAAASASPGYEVVALHTAARFGDPTAAGRLAQLAAQLDGLRAGAAAGYAAALAAADAPALRAVSLRLRGMGDLLAAADATAQAATVHNGCDYHDPSRADAARTRQLAATCQGARTPAILAITVPLPLTPREREVITLVAQGLSNREKAHLLTVSIRTAEWHRHSAGDKLGRTDRAHIAVLLDDDVRGTQPGMRVADYS